MKMYKLFAYFNCPKHALRTLREMTGNRNVVHLVEIILNYFLWLN